MELVQNTIKVTSFGLLIEALKLKKDKITKKTIKECGEKLRTHKVAIGLENIIIGKINLYLCLLNFGVKQITPTITKLNKYGVVKNIDCNDKQEIKNDKKYTPSG